MGSLHIVLCTQALVPPQVTPLIYIYTTILFFNRDNFDLINKYRNIK